MRFRDDRGGFTLVEVMIALAILAIVVLIAASSFRGMMEKYRVEDETKQMFAHLMDARGRAMQRNRAFFVNVNVHDYQTYEDSFPAPNGNGALDNDTLVANVRVRHDIATTIPGGTFRFSRNGIASQAGWIRFSSTAQADYDCITVGATRVKMGKFNTGTNLCDEK